MRRRIKFGIKLGSIRVITLQSVYVPTQVDPLESSVRDGGGLISLATNQKAGSSNLSGRTISSNTARFQLDQDLDTYSSALVAQLDRASRFEREGRGFEPLRAHQLSIDKLSGIEQGRNPPLQAASVGWCGGGISGSSSAISRPVSRMSLVTVAVLSRVASNSTRNVRASVSMLIRRMP